MGRYVPSSKVLVDEYILTATARNIKFYPLALSQAIKEGKLHFIADKFKVFPCQANTSNEAEKKLFTELSTWELLNLRPETILDLGEELKNQFGISSKFLQDALDHYNIQTVGRGPLEESHGITKSMKYFLAKTRHYSWPKGAGMSLDFLSFLFLRGGGRKIESMKLIRPAIAGIGSENMVGIEVDFDAHIDLKLLEDELKKCAKEQIAVYAVVAIIGSTEEGAVDRLSKIVELRRKMQDEEGMSFLVHADAAWGGYFATMLDKNKENLVGKPAKERLPVQGVIPALCLRKETEEDLLALKDADSITVDPHKAGYVPYPAGSLVYRDGRMRHLVTWSSPYLSQGSEDNIGVYGVEGRQADAHILFHASISDYYLQ